MAHRSALRLLSVAALTLVFGHVAVGQEDATALLESSAIDRLIADLVLSEPQAVALRR